MLLDIRIELYDGSAAMPMKLPTAIASTVDDDPIDPRPQCSPTLKATVRPKDPEKHVLGQIEGFIVASQELIAKGVDHLLVGIEQMAACGLVASRALPGRSDIAVPGGNVRPSDRSRLLHETVPLPIRLRSSREGSPIASGSMKTGEFNRITRQADYTKWSSSTSGGRQMIGISLRKTLMVAGGFWLTFRLVLRVNTGDLWLANTVVYHAIVTFMLILTVGAVVRRFSPSRSEPIKS
jgi:hypothetical protein